MLQGVIRSPAPPYVTGWGPLDAAALVAITAIGGALRFLRLGDPRSIMFDETYYARDACWYAYGSQSLCGIEGEQTQVHPPLGKYLVAGGIRLFGYDSFGWRAAAAVAGTLMIAALFILARKLLASTVGATISAGLLTIDPLGFVQSRIAMVDVFAAMFGLVAILCAVYDRDATLQRARGGVLSAPLPTVSAGRRKQSASAGRWRPWRLAAGLAAGAAAASKWSGALAALTVLVVVVAWEIAARRASGRAGALRQTLRSEGRSIALYLVFLPLAVYALSYAGRLEGALLTAPWGPGAWLRAFWDRQAYMLSFHAGLDVTHPYQSPPWSWPLLKRPVSYFFETNSNGDYMEVLATGSPLVWWASLAALAYVAARWAVRRDPAGPEGLILASCGFGYLPWLLLTGDRSAVFLFYLLPVVPFMCLALGYVASDLEPIRVARPAIGLFCAGALALFVFYYPVLAKRPVPRAAWLDRVWVFDNCERPSARQRTVVGRAIEASETDGEDDRPPQGWCWI